MRYLLDTCVVSELTKSAPSEAVLHWLRREAEDDLCLSVITIAELRRGISRLAHGTKRDRLESFFTRLTERFQGRILPISEQVASVWGEVFALERPLSWPDRMIAATAWVHGLTVVTRNGADRANVQVFDPWES